jgi:hypothetical protein
VNFGSYEFPQTSKWRAFGNKSLEIFNMIKRPKHTMCRNLKADLVNGGIKKARVSQGDTEYDIESISADAGEAQQVCYDYCFARNLLRNVPRHSVSWSVPKRETRKVTSGKTLHVSGVDQSCQSYAHQSNFFPRISATKTGSQLNVVRRFDFMGETPPVALPGVIVPCIYR